ncbi:MAG: photosynthetic complex putative assembly protein PuhB [Paracoccaceae bacterium]
MSHDDFDQEPVKGLPELPPEGEVILWQGRPDWWALTKESLNLYWVAAYFVFLALWRYTVLSDQVTIAQAMSGSSPFLVLGAIVCGLLMLTAFIQARATVYTITNRRVAMRIGAALTVTLNLPYTQIANATLDLRKGGTGTIALDLLGDTRLSYLVCWPHVRPWAMRRTQPALRCIPEAAKIAAMLGDAAEKRVSSPVISRKAPAVSSSAVAAE